MATISVKKEAKGAKKKIESRRPHLISLDTGFITLVIGLLQIYLIAHRFKQLASDLSTATSWSHSTSIVINTFILVLAALFTIVYILLNPFRIGVNSHDNFRLGQDLDRTSKIDTNSEFSHKVSRAKHPLIRRLSKMSRWTRTKPPL